jgi:hypothetical protein
MTQRSRATLKDWAGATLPALQHHREQQIGKNRK